MRKVTCMLRPVWVPAASTGREVVAPICSHAHVQAWALLQSARARMNAHAHAQACTSGLTAKPAVTATLTHNVIMSAIMERFCIWIWQSFSQAH